jgi:hypothetical protein
MRRRCQSEYILSEQARNMRCVDGDVARQLP